MTCLENQKNEHEEKNVLKPMCAFINKGVLMVHSISSDLTALMLTAVFTLGSTLNLNRTDL